MAYRRVSKAVLIAAMVAAVALPTVMLGVADAQTTCSASAAYNPSATFAVSPTSAAAGSTVTFSGTGWPADSGVTISVGGTSVGTATTNASGSFSFPYTLSSALATGTSLSASAGCGGLTLGTTISISSGSGAGANTGASSGSAGNLPYTGSDSVRYAGAGLALVAAGGMLVFVTRKRRPAAVDA